MKKLMVIAVLVVSGAAVFAQGDAISKLFGKYASDESFTVVTISSKMFSLITDMEVKSKEDQEVINAISKLKGLKVLHKEDARNARELYKEALALIPVKDYEELIFVRDKDKDMKFFIKEISQGKIGELILVLGGNNEFMLMSLFGEIDLKQVGRMGSRMNVQGLEQLKKLDEKENSKTNSEKNNEED